MYVIDRFETHALVSWTISPRRKYIRETSRCAKVQFVKRVSKHTLIRRKDILMKVEIQEAFMAVGGFFVVGTLSSRNLKKGNRTYILYLLAFVIL